MSRILVDPRVAFGRPYVEGSGVMARTIYNRFKAGEGLRTLERDYDLPPDAVINAIAFEQRCRRRREQYQAPYVEKLARGGLSGRPPTPEDGSWPRVVWPRKGER